MAEGKLPEFNGRTKEFAPWAIKFKAGLLLNGEDIYDIDAYATTGTADHQKKKKRKLGAYIIRHLDDNSVSLFLHLAEDGVELWKALCAHHQTTDRTRQLELRALIDKLKMGGGSLDAYVVRLRALIRDLKLTGYTVTDTDELTMLARGLPSKYEHTTLDLFMDEQMTFDKAVLRLRAHERVMALHDHSGSKKEKKRDRSDSNEKGRGSRRFNGSCHNCGRRGHRASECRKPGGGAHEHGAGRDRGGGYERGGGHSGPPANQGRGATTSAHGAASSNARRPLVPRQGASVVIEREESAMTITTDEASKDDWIVDCAATSHMTWSRDLFDSFEEISSKVTTGNGKTDITGRGTIQLRIPTTEGTVLVVRIQALLVPTLPHHLFSTGQINTDGGHVSLGPNEETTYIVLPGSEKHVQPVRVGENGTICRLPREGEQALVAQAARQAAPLDLWHRRLAHADKSMIKKLPNHVRDMRITTEQGGANAAAPCGPCKIGKMKRQPFEVHERDENYKPGSRVEMDMQGPFPCVQHNRCRYHLTAVDLATHMAYTYPMPDKKGVPKAWEQLKRDIPVTITGVRVDGAGDIGRGRMQEIFEQERVDVQKTNPHTPQQIGTVGRVQAVATDDAKAMLAWAQLPDEYFSYAYEYSVKIRNDLLCAALKYKMTPTEAMTGEKPVMSKYLTFGCMAWAHVPKTARKNKLSANAVQCVFIGHERGIKGHRVVLTDGRVTTVHTLDADETVPGGALLSNVELDDLDPDFEPEKTTSEDSGSTARESTRQRTRRPPGEWYKAHISAEQHAMITYSAAMKSESKRQYEMAMQAELARLEAMGTWQIEDMSAMPAGCKPLRSMWRLSDKRDKNGNIVRYKARLVARGDTQRPGDYNIVFAPVANSFILQTFAAIAAGSGLLLKHIDISAAFIHAPLEETIYMYPPHGMHLERGKVLRLLQSLYGLKQAGHNWYEHLCDVLRVIGFKQAESDTCVFVRMRDDTYTAIAFHVDDLLCLVDTDESFNELLRELSCHVQVGEAGDANLYCGIAVDEDESTITLHQRAFVDKLLSSVDMIDAKARRTPAEPEILTPRRGDEDEYDPTVYRSIVGALMWLALNTRPDIAYAVHRAAMFSKSPGSRHWQALKHIVRYLRGSTRGITFFKSASLVPFAFSDADWGGDPADRASTLGNVLCMAGGVISWCAAKARTPALSSAESEYMALCEGAKSIMFTRMLLSEIGFDVQEPTTIYVDNRSAIAMGSGLQSSSRTKHIEIRLHYTRHLVREGSIQLKWIQSSDNIADIMTKPLGRVAYEKLRDQIMHEV